MRADVSVVIPSLRGGRGLVDLVRSLAEDETSAELLVADNGLPPETVEALRALDAQIVGLGRNVGFGAAVNAAARLAEGDALVVLNDDIVPQKGLLAALVEPLARAEIVAGVLLQAGRPDRIESAGIVLDRLLGAHDYLYGEPLDVLVDPPPAPFGPCGGAAAYLRESFLAAGGFDEALFAYYEDVDLALRLRAAGARCALAPSAVAVHAGSRTLGYGSLEKARRVGFGRGYLLRKYGVLRRPLVGPLAATVELAAGGVLSVRHRSFHPLVARLQGWRACSQRLAPPPESLLTVRLADGLSRRRARGRLASR